MKLSINADLRKHLAVGDAFIYHYRKGDRKDYGPYDKTVQHVIELRQDRAYFAKTEDGERFFAYSFEIELLNEVPM